MLSRRCSSLVEVFLANDDLLKGRYEKALATYQAVELSLPKGSVPFAIRFGIAFSHLYEGHVDEARKAYQKIVDSQWPGIERPLAYPEARRHLKRKKTSLKIGFKPDNYTFELGFSLRLLQLPSSVPPIASASDKLPRFAPQAEPVSTSCAGMPGGTGASGRIGLSGAGSTSATRLDESRRPILATNSGAR